MLSFALGISVHFLVQNTSQSCIQSIEMSPDKFHPQHCPSLSPYCLTTQLTQFTYMKKDATLCFEAKRLILQWNGEPYLSDVIVEAGISENIVKT